MSEIKYQIYKVSEILDYMSGNQGLTKKVIHYDKSNLGLEDVEVLSSSLDKNTSMGYVSKGLILNNKPLKIFENKEGILVSRKGNAGILTYLSNGRYTLNDDAYILFLKEKYKDCIDTLWLSKVLQQEAYRFLSVSEGNKTWSITKFMENGIVPIPIEESGLFNYKLQRELALKYKDIEEKKEILLEKLSVLKKVKVNIENIENNNYKEFAITELFTLGKGNSEYTKQWCQKNKGNIPVYSGNTTGVFSYINKADYNGEYITWAKDGLAGLLMINKGQFSLTGHRGILIPKAICQNIDLFYLKLIIEPIFRASIKGRMGINGKNEYTTLNPVMIKQIKDKIKIPIKEDGSFDLEKQREIAQKYATIESIKRDLYKQVLKLVNTVVK